MYPPDQPWVSGMDHPEEQPLSHHQGKAFTEATMADATNEPIELDIPFDLDNRSYPDGLFDPYSPFDPDMKFDLDDRSYLGGPFDPDNTSYLDFNPYSPFEKCLVDKEMKSLPIEHWGGLISDIVTCNADNLTDAGGHLAGRSYFWRALSPPAKVLHDWLPTPTYGPPTEATVQRRKDRLACIERGVPHHDPFQEWSNALSGRYGEILPTEFYLESPPFPRWSLRGYIRIRFIIRELCIPPYADSREVEECLSYNLSIIRHLILNTVPHPDWALVHDFDICEVKVSDQAARDRNRDLLQAIQEVAWDNEEIKSVLEMATGQTEKDSWTWSRDLRKVRSGELPNGVCPDDPEYAQAVEEYELDVLKKRTARPFSLLRNNVTPEDIPEEEDEEEEEEECF